MKELGQRLLRSAVFWNYLTVALRSGAAILLLPLLLRKLSSEELGLWYVFLSLAGLGALMDFGFGNSFSRSAGYLWAGADRLLPQGVGQGTAASSDKPSAGPNYAMLGQMMVTMKWFYLLLGATVFLLLEFGGGAWVWHKTAGMEHAPSIRLAWAAYALGCALNTLGSYWPTMLTGINGVRQAQKVFLISLVVNYALSIGGLLAGWGLWGPVSGQIAMGILSRVLGRFAFLRLAGPQLQYGGIKPDFALLKILWPNSWRVGAVILGVYTMLSANTLLASGFLDLATTASFGLTMQMALFISQASLVWVMVKLPLINQLRQRGELVAIRQLFFARIWVFLFFYIAGSVTICLAGDWILWSACSLRHGDFGG
ncbi:MAG: polysaccharide biosynthesis protein [Verrucomicrobia bacterium]|nr:polysaccharide biosynthesis protein [Verrucomicrobiota bacterium]